MLGGAGGGIENNRMLTVINSTFSGNNAEEGGGGIDGPASIKSTILAAKTGSNCDGTADRISCIVRKPRH